MPRQRITVPVLIIRLFVFLRFLAAQQAADGVGDGGVGAVEVDFGASINFLNILVGNGPSSGRRVPVFTAD